MKMNYSSFRLVNVAIGPDDNDMQQVIPTDKYTLYCLLHFDTDTVSDTYGKWVCTLDIVSDTTEYPERSLVLYPNTVHFDGDALYSVVITSELDSIGHDDLQNVFMTVGVVADE